jgi:hypothetical protein
MACIHPLVPGSGTELLSRPITLISPGAEIFDLIIFFHMPFNSIQAHVLKMLEILFLVSNPFKSVPQKKSRRCQIMTSYHSAIELWLSQPWNNSYCRGTMASHDPCSSEPGNMDYEYKDTKIRDLVDSMEMAESPLSSSSSLATLRANYHQLGTTPFTAAEIALDNHNPKLEAMTPTSIKTSYQNPAKHNATKAAIRTSTALSNDSSFILFHIARHLRASHILDDATNRSPASLPSFLRGRCNVSAAIGSSRIWENDTGCPWPHIRQRYSSVAWKTAVDTSHGSRKKVRGVCLCQCVICHGCEAEESFEMMRPIDLQSST